MTMKRALALFLCLVQVLALLAVPAYAEDEGNAGNPPASGGGIAVPSEVTPTTLTDREQTLSSFTTITGDETNQYAFVEFKPTQAGYYVLQFSQVVTQGELGESIGLQSCQNTNDTCLLSSGGITNGVGECTRLIKVDNTGTAYQYAISATKDTVSQVTAKYVFAENLTVNSSANVNQGTDTCSMVPTVKVGDVALMASCDAAPTADKENVTVAMNQGPGYVVSGLSGLSAGATVILTYKIKFSNDTTQDATYTITIVENGGNTGEGGPGPGEGEGGGPGGEGGGGEPGSGEGEGGGPGGPGGYVSDTVYLKVFEMGTGSYVMGELGTGIGNTATFLMEYYDGSDFTLVTGTPSYYYQTPNGSVQDTNGDYVTIEKNELGYWDITAKQASNGVLQVTYNGKPYSMNVRFYGGPAVPDSTTTVVDMTGSSEKTATDDQWTTGMENFLYVSYTPTEDGIYAINGAATKESGPMSAGIALCGDDQGLVKGTAASCDETNWNVSIRCDLKKDTTYYFRMTGEPSRMGDVTLTVVKNGALNGGPAENLYDVPDLVWPLTGSVAEGKITNLDSQLNQDAVDIWNSLVDRNDDWYTFYATFTPTEDGVYKLGIFIEGGYLSEAADKPMAQTFLCIQDPLWSNVALPLKPTGTTLMGTFVWQITII